MKPESRLAIYNYLKEQDFELTQDQHKGLKKLLQEAVPDEVTVVYDENSYLFEE